MVQWGKWEYSRGFIFAGAGRHDGTTLKELKAVCRRACEEVSLERCTGYMAPRVMYLTVLLWSGVTAASRWGRCSRSSYTCSHGLGGRLLYPLRILLQSFTGRLSILITRTVRSPMLAWALPSLFMEVWSVMPALWRQGVEAALVLLEQFLVRISQRRRRRRSG